MKKVNFLLIYIILCFFCVNNSVYAVDDSFEIWLETLEKKALKKGVSKKTFDLAMSNVKFLPKVIKYDRYQPEFYEDTISYINKRTKKEKIKSGINLYNKNKLLINSIDEEFLVEKELLLALMGIETNFGTYVGKMDIISSLATLSFDKRRSKFFTNELITMLQLIEKNVIDHKVLYGSWAGAFGYFQFMPSTIMDHAIDYDSDNKIDLKSLKDSFASAANYINKLGWKKGDPCYLKIELNDKIPTTLLNSSAKKIKNKEKLKILKKYIKDPDKIKFDENMKVAIITPDIDIIPDANTLNPAYLVFENYEIILKWNRSLRFGLAVCNLKDKFKNEI